MFISKDIKELSGLYELIAEATEFNISNFTEPPPRAKFQTGNFVTTRDNGNFKSYHTKKHLPYANKAGEIVGYYNYPGAYTKYTIKFDDGSIVPIHSNFILGPFKTLEIAKEYEDVTKEVDTNDMQQASGKPLAQNWQISERYENEAKKVLTQDPYNFQWHDTPIVIKIDPYVDERYVTFELARKGRWSLTRQHNKITKKLSTGSKGGYNLSMPQDFCKAIYDEDQYYYSPFCTTNLQRTIEHWYAPKDIKYLGSELGKKRFKINFELQNINEINDEVFLKIVSLDLQQTADGYNIIVPKGSSFYYSPYILKACPIVDNVTITGDVVAVEMYTNQNSLFRSPKRINGNFKCSISPDDFRLMPTVTGNIEFVKSADANKYKEYLANTSYEHPDIKDLMDF